MPPPGERPLPVGTTHRSARCRRSLGRPRRGAGLTGLLAALGGKRNRLLEVGVFHALVTGIRILHQVAARPHLAGIGHAADALAGVFNTVALVAKHICFPAGIVFVGHLYFLRTYTTCPTRITLRWRRTAHIVDGS